MSTDIIVLLIAVFASILSTILTSSKKKRSKSLESSNRDRTYEQSDSFIRSCQVYTQDPVVSANKRSGMQNRSGAGISLNCLEENELHSAFEAPIDIRQAIIYEAILTPKFKEY